MSKRKGFNGEPFPSTKFQSIIAEFLDHEEPMKSELQPYQQRVIEEKQALDKKLNALKDFLDTNAFNFWLTAQEQELLRLQNSYMQSYSNILAERISLFNV